MRLAAICVLILLMAGAALASDFSVRPSVFTTFGTYSDERDSREVAAYATVALKNLQFVSVGFSDLNIHHPAWKYHQQMPVGGVMLSHLPLRVKAYYGHIQGTFEPTDALNPMSGALYKDKADVFSAEAIYSKQWYDLGVEAVAFTGNGLSYSDTLRGKAPRQTATQFTGRITCLLNQHISATVRPTYVHVQDGRKLYSMYVKAVYAPIPRWTFAGGGFIGERAYYFDNDLLVIFNQTETQRGMLFGQAEVRVWKSISFSAEYIYTQFEGLTYSGYSAPDYSIKYIVAGLKSRFPF